MVLERIHWLGHDTFRIDGPLTIYFDPYKLSEGNPKADVILISHDHHDHCSPEDVDKVLGEDTLIVTIATAAERLTGDVPSLSKDNVQVVEPGDVIQVRGVEVEAVPAYNVDKFRSPGVPFHPREAGHVGFVVTLEGKRIYHAGDTDCIPEMKNLTEIHIALLPVSGIYVMTADEAVEAAEAIRPGVAIPMHIGRGIGSLDAAQVFKEKAPVDVAILEIE
ncbi:MAG: MBL fold metallo-hydrolase [Anaerolineae bacterium]|jgi:L-ascorbate metabolism protein UlaG (beta-lactamase superfamily)